MNPAGIPSGVLVFVVNDPKEVGGAPAVDAMLPLTLLLVEVVLITASRTLAVMLNENVAQVVDVEASFVQQ